MNNLFLLAAQNKYRFPSRKGVLTAEQLFDLPLTSANGASLDDTARTINAELKSVTEESFVDVKPTPGKIDLANRLEIVKTVIEIKQSQNAARAAQAERAAKRDRILAAIDEAERRELSQSSVDELRKQLAEL